MAELAEHQDTTAPALVPRPFTPIVLERGSVSSAAGVLALQRVCGNRAGSGMLAQRWRVLARQSAVDAVVHIDRWRAAVVQARSDFNWDPVAVILNGYSAHDQDLLLGTLSRDELMRLGDASRRALRGWPGQTAQRVEFVRSQRDVAARPAESAARVANLIAHVRAHAWDVDDVAEGLSIEELRQLPADVRVSLIGQIAGGWRVGDDDETTIIRLVATSPPDQRSAVLAGLRANRFALLRTVDSALDGDNNAEFYNVLRLLSLSALDPQAALQSLTSAPVLPWARPQGFRHMGGRTHYREPTFLADGRLHIEYEETGGMFTVPYVLEIDPLALVMIWFPHGDAGASAHAGDLVPMPAVCLLGLYHGQFRNELAAAVNFGFMLGGAASLVTAGSRAAMLAAGLDWAMGSASLAVDSYREELSRTEAGRAFLTSFTILQTLLLIYGAARLVLAAPASFRNLRAAFGRWRAASPANAARLEPQVRSLLEAENQVQGALAQTTPAATTPAVAAPVAAPAVPVTPVRPVADPASPPPPATQVPDAPLTPAQADAAYGGLQQTYELSSDVMRALRRARANMATIRRVFGLAVRRGQLPDELLQFASRANSDAWNIVGHLLDGGVDWQTAIGAVERSVENGYLRYVQTLLASRRVLRVDVFARVLATARPAVATAAESTIMAPRENQLLLSEAARQVEAGNLVEFENNADLLVYGPGGGRPIEAFQFKNASGSGENAFTENLDSAGRQLAGEQGEVPYAGTRRTALVRLEGPGNRNLAAAPIEELINRVDARGAAPLRATDRIVVINSMVGRIAFVRRSGAWVRVED